MVGAADIKSYKDLLVWQQSVELAVLCYRLSRKFPKADLFGLTASYEGRPRRSPQTSEGHGRESSLQFVQFLRSLRVH
jgi:hypothetical protein